MADANTKLRGVNLGGWLVLEKWMTPSLFTGITGPDEFSFCSELGVSQARELLAIHREHFITEADFKWIAAHGLNAVRLPIGYWIFGAQKPFVGGIEYVDRALDWAEQYGLQLVLDVHGAPGSQNGLDHSGQAGKIRWHQANNIDQTLQFLEKLCRRYAGVVSLRAVELLNEPSWRLGRSRLTHYYQRGYDIVRSALGPDVAVIMPDAYKPKRWQHALTGPDYHNVWLDIHLYQTFGRADKRRTIDEHIRRTLKRIGLVEHLQTAHPVIVGEWSAALPAEALQPLDETERLTARRTYAAMQEFAQYDALGWFYWNYKTETGGAWSLRDGVQRGWLPNRFD